MNLQWYAVRKSPYAYELGTVTLLIDKGASEDYHYFASISKEHPKKWNRDQGKNDIDFTKIDWIVSVPDMDATVICESEEKAHREVKRLLYDYTNMLHRFCQDTDIPTL